MSKEYCTEQVFQDLGSCKSVTLAMATTQTANTSKTIYIPPNADTTLLGTDTNQTITNKTIGSSTIQSDCTITNPIADLLDSTFTVSNTAAPTKKIKFECGSITAGQTRTLTVPDANLTIVGVDTNQTLTNKTLTAPVISTISNTGTLTLPTSTDTLVGRATTDTLTNKTLTAPVISTISNTGTLTLPTATTTLTGRNTTDTLTNKTMSDASNTFTYSVSTCTATDWTTPIASKSYTFYAVKLGYAVFLHFPILSSTTNGATTFTKTGIVPSGYRPPQQVEFIVNVQNNTFTTGLLVITTGGDVTIYATLAGGNFTSGSVSFRIGNWCVSYVNAIA